ncbi:MAG: AraC family transcriptional regulator [Archangium sp.]
MSSAAAVSALHSCIPERGYATLWRDGSVSAAPGYGPRHRNPGYELTWVREGFVSFALAGAQQSITMKTGGVIVLNPGELNTPYAQGAMFQLMLSPTAIDDAREQLGVSSTLPTSAFSFAPGTRVSAIAGMIARERRALEDDDPLVKSLADALILSLVRPEQAQAKRRDPAVSRAIDFLQAHHSERLSIDDVARAIGLPRFALMRRFKEQTGTSLYQHLQNVRLDRAAHALRSGSESVLSIALSSGFTDPGRFARAFRQRFGAAPMQFRARFA